MKRRNCNPQKAAKMIVKMPHKSHPLHFVHGTQLLKEGFSPSVEKGQASFKFFIDLILCWLFLQCYSSVKLQGHFGWV